MVQCSETGCGSTHLKNAYKVHISNVAIVNNNVIYQYNNIYLYEIK